MSRRISPGRRWRGSFAACAKRRGFPPTPERIAGRRFGRQPIRRSSRSILPRRTPPRRAAIAQRCAGSVRRLAGGRNSC
jgi:hypothetical protein